MYEFEIDCVSRTPTGSTHDHITHIGNSAGKWRLSRADAVAQITVKASRFYLMDRLSGKPIYLDVIREGNATPILRTRINDEWSDSLMTLPECGKEFRTV